MDPLSIHTAMTILNLLRLLWSSCPHGHTSFSIYRFSVTDSHWVFWFQCPLSAHWSFSILMPSIGIHRSPFLVYPLLVLLDPCSMWQMWYNKWHIVSALIFSAFHVVLEHSSLSFYRLSVIDSGESFFRGSLSFILF